MHCQPPPHTNTNTQTYTHIHTHMYKCPRHPASSPTHVQDVKVAAQLGPASQPLSTATLNLSHALASLDSQTACMRSLHDTLRAYVAAAGAPHTQTLASQIQDTGTHKQEGSAPQQERPASAYAPSPVHHNTQVRAAVLCDYSTIQHMCSKSMRPQHTGTGGRFV